MKDEGKPTGSALDLHPSSFSVSVALCTYNGARYLRQQLDSLAAQTRRPDEVVVGDDASTDDSVAIVETWARETGIPTYITRNQPGLGPTRNFEATIARCRGDVICPCDQDDVWLPTKIEKTGALIQRDPGVTFAICQSEICSEDLAPRGVTVFDDQRFTERYRTLVRSGEGFDAYLRHLVAPGHAMAFRKTLFDRLFPFPDTCVHDQWIALIASAVGKTALADESLVRYRYHQQNALGGSQKTLLDWSAAQGKLKLDHLQRNIDTYRALRDRLPQLNIDGKIRFLESRKSMRAGRLKRTTTSLKLYVLGQYHRYGRGLLTFLRDLKG
jgi:glycosyltransferase involved in cell wall biosynthesis